MRHCADNTDIRGAVPLRWILPAIAFVFGGSPAEAITPYTNAPVPQIILIQFSSDETSAIASRHMEISPMSN
ncbi:hypothetical protein ACE1AT_00995 [Pelatocladus sp. BLCC-F211]|uniref:hypothetical protein n=1 Tax=Pelatocladus sp. BLCC-F211 TaxID=3342752 RepID=UPI0035B9BAFD